ncbi:Uncharacterized mitochondrial protein AtMg00810 [Striga hermonthica]|uniref:Uncharacterized mitochondrial protein AtMg00810 n=1 Tax=Striga hermonthica TaxID=68872 RepID=A0A9N7N7R7_STRHE|nr:Uncharacterized mitochondrial protein AtMg00810 [Striga hermonthica]
MYLKQRLYGLKMQEGTDLGQHVNIFNQVVTDLASLEVKIEDEDKMMILLCSLPPSYEHMGNQDRGRRHVRDNSGNWNFRSKSRDKSKGRKTVTCYKCKEQGHFKWDCPKWKKQTADMSSKSANVVQNEESDCSDGDMLSISTAQNGFIPKADEDRETIKIVKGALTVMKGRITAGNIYKLLETVLDKGESSSSAPDDVDHDVSGPTDVPESYKLARDRVRRTNIQAPIGYKRCEFDCCVYTKSLGDGSMIFLLLYVDDMLIAAKNMRDIVDLKSLLSQEFEMKDLGAAKKILGMEIHRDRGSQKLWLSLKGYVEKVLQRFAMNEAKPVSTPLANHFKLSVDQCPKSDKETLDMVEIPYASAVGCLMYAMECTRPDLAHAVGQVCKYMSRPGKQHWEAVKWIFRYLKGTAGHGIVFRDQRLDFLVVGYVDSDYAGDLDNRRSTTGYVFTFEMTGGSKFEVSKFDGHGNFGLWQTRERAAGTIRLCLADEVMYHVMHLKSADDIWKKLESQFMSKTLTTKLYLKQRLYGLKMQEGNDLGQHVNIFNQVVTDLASLKVKMEDEDKAMILLCSLPSSYEHMVTTLTYGKEMIKTEEITSALLAHNQRKQKSGESSSQSDSLYVKGNQDRGRRQVRDNSGNRNFRSKSRDKSKGRTTMTCYKCKEQWHFKRDCPKWQKETADMSSKLQMWYIMRNLIAVMEICCLFRLRSNSGSVFLGDDRCCGIVGIGDVKIRINGFIPKADEDRQTIKIVKGTLTVMKGRITAGNIYKLLGTVLDKGESSSSAPDDVDHDVSGPSDVPESYKLARDRVRRTNIQAPEFEMKDLGAAKKILGMEIHRDRGSKKLWLSQKGYVEKVLQRFGMNEANPVSTPLANHFKLSVDQCPKSDKETQDIVEIPYASAVGCLMYAIVCTRPDLAHAVGQVGKYMSRPGKQHWESVKWIFRYLKGTAGHGIVFGDQRLDPLVVGYVDSDYAGDLDNRRSTTGSAPTLPACESAYRNARQLAPTLHSSAMSSSSTELLPPTSADTVSPSRAHGASSDVDGHRNTSRPQIAIRLRLQPTFRRRLSR